MIKYIIAYIIFSYFVNLIITAYIFKYDHESLFSGSFKNDISPLTVFAIFWGFSPIMLPLVTVIYIINYIKENILSRS